MRPTHVHRQAILRHVVGRARWRRALAELCPNYVHGLRVPQARLRVLVQREGRPSFRVVPKGVTRDPSEVSLMTQILEWCRSSKRFARARLPEGYTCGAGFVCNGDAATYAHGCAVIDCSQTAGYVCPTNTDCSATPPNSRCVTRKCTTSSDCQCGTCLDGSCANRPRICLPPQYELRLGDRMNKNLYVLALLFAVGCGGTTQEGAGGAPGASGAAGSTAGASDGHGGEPAQGGSAGRAGGASSGSGNGGAGASGASAL